MNTQKNIENIIYPAIVFKVKDGYYAVNSENVATIMQVPDFEILPDAPKSVVGIFKFRNNVIPLISVRTLFGMPTLREESAEFTTMLETRKQDHINWVRELTRCVQVGEAFTLAKDPHKCAFGRWYDQYETNIHSIKVHLNKIEEPHRLLHESAEEITRLMRETEERGQSQKVKTVLNRVQDEYMPKIMEFLDDAKEMFDAVNHSMLIVIDQGDYGFALAVDEVLSVEELADVANEENVERLQGSQYLSEIKKSSKLSRLILMLDDTKIGEIAKNYALQEA